MRLFTFHSYPTQRVNKREKQRHNDNVERYRAGCLVDSRKLAAAFLIHNSQDDMSKVR